MVELVNDPTPFEEGDAALVNRGGSPAMVELSAIAQTGDYGDLSNKPPYLTRQDFLDAQIPASVVQSAFIIGGRSYSVVRDEDGPIEQTNGDKWRPDGDVFIEHFGATPYNSLVDVADPEALSSSPAIAAAVAYVGSFQGTLHATAAWYRITETMLLDQPGITFVGQGFESTHFVCTDGDFHLMHIPVSRVFVRDMEIRGTSSYFGLGPSKNAHGLLIEPTTVTLIVEHKIERVRMNFIRGSGLVMNCESGLATTDLTVVRAGRHGVCLVNPNEGDIAGTVSSGMVNMQNNRIGSGDAGCGGHSLMVGAPSGSGSMSAYRIYILNHDCGVTHQDPDLAATLEPAAIFFRARESVYEGGSTNGGNTRAGILVAGVQNTVGRIRYTRCAKTVPLCIVKNYGGDNVTRNITIFGGTALGWEEAPFTLDECVKLDNVEASDDVRVLSGFTGQTASAPEFNPGPVTLTPERASVILDHSGVRSVSGEVVANVIEAETYAGAGAQSNNAAGRLDSTTGLLMRVGGFIGGSSASLWPNSDFNDVSDVGMGFYRVDSSISNRPEGLNCFCLLGRIDASRWVQVIIRQDNVMQYRISSAGPADNPTWGSYQTVSVT